jgi:hypothetical protein
LSERKYIVEVPFQVAFTGSTEIGKILRQATAGTGKKLSLELGGNFEDNLFYWNILEKIYYYITEEKKLTLYEKSQRSLLITKHYWLSFLTNHEQHSQ